MRAIRQSVFGPAEVLAWVEIEDPAPGEGQVSIAVEAAGVHLLDTTIRSGEAFGAMARPELPFVPGREVDGVGPGVDVEWLGRRVVVHLGPASGGYAERVVAPIGRVHVLPDHLDAATAVAAIGTGRTATGILDLAPISADDVVLVTSAAGGLGVLLLQAAKASGARVIAVASGAKQEVAEQHGADVVLDRHDADWGEALPAELSLVFDAVGGPVGRTAFAALRPGGRLVRYGWSSGEQNTYGDPERHVVEVLGPAMLARDGGLASLEAEALARAADGSRRPWVGSRFPLRDAASAHRALESGVAVGKVVLDVER